MLCVIFYRAKNTDLYFFARLCCGEFDDSETRRKQIGRFRYHHTSPQHTLRLLFFLQRCFSEPQHTLANNRPISSLRGECRAQPRASTWYLGEQRGTQSRSLAAKPSANPRPQTSPTMAAANGNLTPPESAPAAISDERTPAKRKREDDDVPMQGKHELSSPSLQTQKDILEILQQYG